MGCEPVLEVSGVSKRFCSDLNRSLRYGVMDIAREFLPISTPRQGLRRDEFWAVDDVSFTVQPGEAIAIAGRNGAGKSTLMRLLAGILKPDRGEISLTGRVNPVIELGQGLNSLLTGRENAALGMAWRGAERRHIEDLVEQVAAFSDLGDFFDSPISQYSAGMRVRLAFAIAAHIPARLMVLDEVLSVGDVAFQVKCMRKVREHLDDGGSLILVSHNPFQMQTVCSRGLLMDQGRIVFDGPIEHCLDRALDAQLGNPAAKAPARPRNPQALEVLGVSLSTDLPEGKLRPGGAFDVTVHYRTPRPVTLLFGISIWSADGSLCLAHFPDTHPVALRPGTGQKRCHISSLPLAHGRYSVRAVLIDPETMFAVASFGFDDAPALFMVEDDVSRIAILARNAGQILKLPSAWSDVSDVTIDESDEA